VLPTVAGGEDVSGEVATTHRPTRDGVLGKAQESVGSAEPFAGFEVLNKWISTREAFDEFPGLWLESVAV
jgi:hypothetical protein